MSCKFLRCARPGRRCWFAMGACLTGLWPAGCALTPRGTDQESARVEHEGRAFQAHLEDRSVPDLPPSPDWRDVLQRAFLVNGDLESAYFDWKAAVERIGIASSYPNSNVMVGYSYAFSSGQMKAFDRMTFSAGFDSTNLELPMKAAQKGLVALDDARAAGERFRAAKFELQKRVLTAWADYALLGERERIRTRQVTLDRMAGDAATARAQVRPVQRDLLRAETSTRTDEDAAQTDRAALAAACASLNAMLGRPADEPIVPPAATPTPRPMPADDVILAAAVDQNPELASLAQQVRGRADALELARMRWIPDINPSFMFTGTISQAVGTAVMLPTTIAAIKGGIRESESMLRAGEATLRQAKLDRAAAVVATLVMLRNDERQAALYGQTIVPLAERTVADARESYALGTATFTDLLNAERTLLDAHLVVAEARTMREKRLAELEALMGIDVETLLRPAQPTGGDASRADLDAAEGGRS